MEDLVLAEQKQEIKHPTEDDARDLPSI